MTCEPLEGRVILSVTPANVPDGPTNLVALGLGYRNKLTFQDNSTIETAFVVERRLAVAPDTAFAPIPGSPFPVYGIGYTGPVTIVDSPVDPDVLYAYRVSAQGTASPGVYSNVAIARQMGLKATIFDTSTF